MRNNENSAIPVGYLALILVGTALQHSSRFREWVGQQISNGYQYLSERSGSQVNLEEKEELGSSQSLIMTNQLSNQSPISSSVSRARSSYIAPTVRLSYSMIGSVTFATLSQNEALLIGVFNAAVIDSYFFGASGLGSRRAHSLSQRSYGINNGNSNILLPDIGIPEVDSQLPYAPLIRSLSSNTRIFFAEPTGRVPNEFRITDPHAVSLNSSITYDAIPFNGPAQWGIPINGPVQWAIPMYSKDGDGAVTEEKLISPSATANFHPNSRTIAPLHDAKDELEEEVQNEGESEAIHLTTMFLMASNLYTNQLATRFPHSSLVTNDQMTQMQANLLDAELRVQRQSGNIAATQRAQRNWDNRFGLITLRDAITSSTAALLSTPVDQEDEVPANGLQNG